MSIRLASHYIFTSPCFYHIHPRTSHLTFHVIYGQFSHSQTRPFLVIARGQLPDQPASSGRGAPISGPDSSAHVQCHNIISRVLMTTRLLTYCTSNLTFKVQTIIPSDIQPQTLICYTSRGRQDCCLSMCTTDGVILLIQLEGWLLTVKYPHRSSSHPWRYMYIMYIEQFNFYAFVLMQVFFGI